MPFPPRLVFVLTKPPSPPHNRPIHPYRYPVVSEKNTVPQCGGGARSRTIQTILIPVVFCSEVRSFLGKTRCEVAGSPAGTNTNRRNKASLPTHVLYGHILVHRGWSGAGRSGRSSLRPTNSVRQMASCSTGRGAGAPPRLAVGWGSRHG